MATDCCSELEEAIKEMVDVVKDGWEEIEKKLTEINDDIEDMKLSIIDLEEAVGLVKVELSEDMTILGENQSEINVAIENSLAVVQAEFSIVSQNWQRLSTRLNADGDIELTPFNFTFDLE